MFPKIVPDRFFMAINPMREFLTQKRRKVKSVSGTNIAEAINPRRRRERVEMRELGFRTKKAYRKYQKKQRRLNSVVAAG
jgi:hypothetical protein